MGWVNGIFADVWAYVSGPLWEAKEWLLPALVAQSGATLDALVPGVSTWLDERAPWSAGLRVKLAQTVALLALFMAGFLAWNGERAASQDARDGRRGAESRVSDLERELSAVSTENASLRARPTPEEARQLQGELQEAQAEAATMRQRISQLEARLAPRRLDAAKTQRFFDALDRWKGAYDVEFAFRPGSQEIADFGNDLIKVLAGVGWMNKQPYSVKVDSDATPTGLTISYRDDQQGAVVLVQLLREMGIPVSRGDHLPDGRSIRVFVSERAE